MCTIVQSREHTFRSIDEWHWPCLSIQHGTIQPVLVNELKPLGASTLRILTPPLFPLQCPVDLSLWSSCMSPLCQLSDVYTNTSNPRTRKPPGTFTPERPSHIPSFTGEIQGGVKDTHYLTNGTAKKDIFYFIFVSFFSLYNRIENQGRMNIVDVFAPLICRSFYIHKQCRH